MQGITWKHAFLGLILMESLGLALVLPSGAMVKRSNDVSAKTRRESLSLDKTLHIRDDHDDDDDDDDDDDYGYYWRRQQPPRPDNGNSEQNHDIRQSVEYTQANSPSSDGPPPPPQGPDGGKSKYKTMAIFFESSRLILIHQMGLDGGHNRIPLLLVRTVVMMVLEGEPNTQIPHHGRIMVAIDLNRDREIKIPRHHLGQIMVIVDFTLLDGPAPPPQDPNAPRPPRWRDNDLHSVWQQKQAPPKAPGDQPGGPNPGSGPDQPGSNPKPPRDVNRD
ncbi:hypothetical protein CSUB01_04888 [Colletotrichum sublineola]|uniref:Uncharacterized protein n=1 Tax=Colletotrichum sublineola TaxID=1173701 RepID=A0A066X9J7_COLSU|nr:hypothetical protein CSUB01_04888 [Colletotrichum sublineola]